MHRLNSKLDAAVCFKNGFSQLEIKFCAVLFSTRFKSQSLTSVGQCWALLMEKTKVALFCGKYLLSQTFPYCQSSTLRAKSSLTYKCESLRVQLGCRIQLEVRILVCHTCSWPTVIGRNVTERAKIHHRTDPLFLVLSVSRTSFLITTAAAAAFYLSFLLPSSRFLLHRQLDFEIEKTRNETGKD